MTKQRVMRYGLLLCLSAVCAALIAFADLPQGVDSGLQGGVMLPWAIMLVDAVTALFGTLRRNRAEDRKPLD